MNQPATRILTAAASLFAVMLFFAGCVVTSIYPYYTDKDLVFDPALLGDWVEAGQTNESSEFARIEQTGEKDYQVTILGTGETNSSDAHLFRLKQQLFLDTCPTNRSLDFVPDHQVSKVTQTGPGLETANLNYDWLARLLEKNPRAVRHMFLPDNHGDAHGRIVLTADTKELQRFILNYVNHTNAWEAPTQWEHRN